MTSVTQPMIRPQRPITQFSWRPSARTFLIALIIVLGVTLVAPAMGTPAVATSTTTTTANLNLRSGPGYNHSILTVMVSGSTLTVLGSADNGFYPVSFNGNSGWALGDYLASTQSSGSANESAVTTAALNMRTGASLQNGVVTVIPNGASITVTGSAQNSFYPVQYNGMTGWAHSDWIRSSETASSAENNSAVTTAALNMRSGASLDRRVVTVIPNGATVSITGGAQNGFYPVEYRGSTGWAHGDWLSTGSASAAPEPEPEVIDSAVTTANLNMRSSPSLNSSVQTVIPAGTTVGITGSSDNGFQPVRYSGRSGWAHGSYLSRSGSNSGASQSEQQIIDIIYAAADRYGQPRSDMLRVAQCESNLDPKAVGRLAHGLFQFLPGTWATTPFADDDIYDAYANANAAAWMWSVGRRNEWVCQ